VRPLAARGFASRNQSDDVVGFDVTMHDHEQPKRGAQPKQDKAILLCRMLRIVQRQTVLIRDRRLGLGEGDAVLALVEARFGRIPFEAEIAPALMYVRRTYMARSCCAA
jgi:hypothetical protein